MVIRIKEKREDMRMSQAELARLSGVSRVTISNLETGKATDVKIATCFSIASALGCKLDDIFLPS